MSNEQPALPSEAGAAQGGRAAGQGGSKKEPLDAREIELLTSQVADAALKRIVQRARWPLLMAGALAAYTGWNLYDDVQNKLSSFTEAADHKLEEIDRNANQRLDQKLTEILDERKEDIAELTRQLRSESASAVVEAERARAEAGEAKKQSLRSAETAVDEANQLVARVQRRADETIAALERQLEEARQRKVEVVARLDSVVASVGRSRDPEPDEAAPLLTSQPAFSLIGVEAAQDEVGEGQPVDVAILSTGVTFPEPGDAGNQFADRVLESRSFVDGEDAEDGNGYGTAIASLIASIAPSARLVSAKVLSDRGSGGDATILAGMNWILADARARVVVLTAGRAMRAGEPPQQNYTRVIERLRQANILVIAPVGNDSRRPYSVAPVASPANVPAAFSVAATSLEDNLLGFSNAGPEVDIAAPGEDIQVLWLDGEQRSLSGTGPALGIAAGVVALVLAARPDLSVQQVESILKSSAKPLSLGEDEVGAGRIDALAAVRLARTSTR